MAEEPEQGIPPRRHAAGYVRVSQEVQALGHSPDIQRQAIQRYAVDHGYILVLIEEDHESGSKLTRAGYQRILSAARQGRLDALIVHMFDRWGRDGVEWLDRVRELESLRIPLISVQEGQSQRGILRYVVAGMAEEYSVTLAKRIRPARESSARRGVHQGMTPYLGYTRVYDPPLNGRRQAGRLVVDPATAWVVRELFARYAAGGETLRSLATWLNDDERVPPHPTGERWMPSSVRSVLRNPTYVGLVRHNHERRGRYESSAPGDEFIVQGLHDALVSRELFDQVQEVMRRAAEHTSHRRPIGPELSLLPGLLRCAQCGGPITRHRNRRGHPIRYECVYRRRGVNGCCERSMRADLADAAVLREVARLRAASWTPAVDAALLGTEPSSKELAQVERSLERDRERLRRHTRLLSALGEDPSEEQVAAYQDVAAEITARLRTLESRRAALRVEAPVLPQLRTLHARLQADLLPGHLQRLAEAARTPELRTLLAQLVESARIVERVPPGFKQDCLWLRAAVEWTAPIRALLRVGALTLTDPPVAPEVETWQERKRRKDAKKWSWAARKARRAAADGAHL